MTTSSEPVAAGPAPAEPVDIVYVIASMITGGTQTHLMQVFEFLDRSRFRPRLFALRDGGNLVEAAEALDVPVQTFGMRGSLRHPQDYRGLGRMVSALRANRPDVVHGYLLRGNFYGSLAGRMAGVPVVLTSKRGLHAPAGAAERFSVGVSNRLSAVVTGNAPQVLDFTREVEGFTGPMEMIPSGIDLDRFDPDRIGDEPRRRIRAELGIGDKPVLGAVITFRPRKGFGMLFRATARLVKGHPDLQVIIAGEKPMPEEPAKLAAELGITDRIHLLGRRSDMPEVLSAFDIFTLPSESEGMSNAILEAMAMRKAVVATSVGAAPVCIDDDRTGCLLEYGDDDALVEKIGRFLADPGLGERMGTPARTEVIERFSAPSMVRQMQDLYLRLLDAKNR